MAKVKLDAETEKVLSEADHVRNMLDSDGWRIVKQKLDVRILDLQNINNLDLANESNTLFDLKARKLASDILFAWMKDDLYGFVQQQEDNQANAREKGSDIIELHNI